MSAGDDKKFQQRMQRVESLLQQVERFADPAARDAAREVVQALMDLHGAALAAMLERAAAAGETGRALIDAFADDDLVSSVLLLYGLHPLGLEERVRRALQSVRPALSAHHGDVELLGIEDGVVRLRLLGSCDGCPSSAVTLKTTVEEAIVAAAPDAVAVEVEGQQAGAADSAGRIALPVLGGR